MEVTRIDNVTRTFKTGKVETQALRGRQSLHRKRRVYCPGWAIWLR